MKKNLSFILFLLNALSISAQQWYLTDALRPRSTNHIEIFDQNTLLVAGGNLRNDSIRSVFRTNDSGLLWDVNLDVITSWIKSVAFTDSLNGIAVCAGGRIIKTTDSGRNWTPLSSPANRDFNKIFLIDSMNAIVVGGLPNNQFKTIIKTSDGGQNWQVIVDQSGFWLNSVYFPDADTGYAVGDSGTILKSTDGGSSWGAVSSPIQRNLNAIYFADANNGFIVGGNLAHDSIRTILSTSDGGQTWAILKDELGGWLTDIIFIDQNTGFAVGDRATLLKTMDGGQSWIPQTVNGSLPTDYFITVKFHDQNYGIIGARAGRVFIYNSSAPPEVYTTGSIIIDSTQVRLTGAINSSGYGAQYSFFYSSDSLFSSFAETFSTSIQSASATPVEKLIYGLIPNTTYYFFIKAYTLGGTAYGDTLSFFTGTPATLFETLPASLTSSSSVQLNGILSNFSFTPVDLFFEYGTSPALGSQVQATPSTVNDTLQHIITATISPLQPIVTHYFRLKGVTASSGTYYGDINDFFAGTPYLSFETVSATSISDSTAILNGYIDKFQLPVNLSFEFGTSPAFGNELPAYPSVVDDSLSHTITLNISSLQSGTLYYFRLKGQTSLGTFYGNTIIFFTNGTFSAFETLPATDVTTASAQLNGNINGLTINAAISFEYGTTLSLGNEITATPDSITDTQQYSVSAVITGLQSGILYYYRLKGNSVGADFFGEIKQIYVGTPPIPNWDFEYWDNITDVIPQEWLSLGGVSQATSYDGSWAISLQGNHLQENFSKFGGVLFGSPNDEEFNGGVPFPARPDSLIGYFNYDIPPNDSALILLVLKKNGQINSENYFFIPGSSGGSFQRLSFPIVYTNTDVPDSIILGFVSTNPFSEPEDRTSHLELDNIFFAGTNVNVPNANFEIWKSVTYDKLDSWLTSDDERPVGYPATTVLKTTDSQNGYFAAEIKAYADGTENISAGIYTSRDMKPSFPVNFKHTTFHCHLKYFPENSDSLGFYISMYQNSQQIGGVWFFIDTLISDYTPLTLPISYYGPNVFPDSATIQIFIGGSSRTAQGNSVAFIDNLSFDGFLTSVKQVGLIPASPSEYAINVYPNPAENSFSVEILTNVLSDEVVNILLLDMQGRIAKELKMSGGKTKIEIETRDLPPGLYILRFNTGKKSLSRKIILLK